MSEEITDLWLRVLNIKDRHVPGQFEDICFFNKLHSALMSKVYSQMKTFLLDLETIS